MFKHHHTNTDVRFYWQQDGLTDEDYAIMRLGCVPMITEERELAVDRRRDIEIMDRWTRTCTALRKHGINPTKFKLGQVKREIDT